jgi:hypothetical protein
MFLQSLDSRDSQATQEVLPTPSPGPCRTLYIIDQGVALYGGQR